MNKKYENKILLVDDDTKNLQVAMNILKDYNVIYAQSGEKALELLEKNKFDLILLDIVMPTMNGFDVCYKIKNDDKIKFYLQSLDFEAENKKELESNDIFNKTLNEVDKLDEIMYDFHKFFSNQSDKEEVNIKVSFDNAIFSLKDEIKDLNIDINVEGDNLLSLNIVVDEIKHIFGKLLNKSIENFKSNSDLQNKYINVNIETVKESIFISYLDNSKIYDDTTIEKLFLPPNSLINEDFDLGYYLVKVFIEKNFGLMMVRKTEDGIKYIIRFNK